jgi:hypothetical protein
MLTKRYPWAEYALLHFQARSWRDVRLVVQEKALRCPATLLPEQLSLDPDET